jgi:hypothetical protein
VPAARPRARLGLRRFGRNNLDHRRRRVFCVPTLVQAVTARVAAANSSGRIRETLMD